MAKKQPPVSRVTITDIPDSLRIVISGSRSWFVIGFLGLWICAWAVAEVMIPAQFLQGAIPSEAQSLLFAWFGVWTVGGLLAIYALLWQAIGKEMAAVQGQVLITRRDIGGFGFNKVYNFSQIHNLRVGPSGFNPLDISAALQLWGIGGGMILFDYETKTHRFGAGLDEAEAKRVVTAMKKRSHEGVKPER